MTSEQKFLVVVLLSTAVALALAAKLSSVNPDHGAGSGFSAWHRSGVHRTLLAGRNHPRGDRRDSLGQRPCCGSAAGNGALTGTASGSGS